MNSAQIQVYWMDKVNQVSLACDSPFEEGYLLADLEQSINEWSINPAVGLPFYQSRAMTRICTGWDYGHLVLNAMFSGKGKTSFTFNKVIMSCIENKEKLIVIANEQSLDEFKKLLLTAVMGSGTKEWFNRQRLNEGNFTNDEEAKLKRAAEWVKSICEDQKLIVFVFMEQYTMTNVKKVLLHYANRGYRRVIIDTGKASDDQGDKARWEKFSEDMKDLYKMIRPNGGGLNLACWVNVQLADGALGRRFLNEHALGVAKAIKNESSVLFLHRPVWDDEYKGGAKAIKVHKREYNDITEEWDTKEFELDRYYTDDKGNQHENIYYLMFTAKNRRGQDNNTGLDVLVFRADFGRLNFYEVGWCKIFNDNNY
jgi:hypothetical protein